jgi:hypothetical protein
MAVVSPWCPPPRKEIKKIKEIGDKRRKERKMEEKRGERSREEERGGERRRQQTDRRAVVCP